MSEFGIVLGDVAERGAVPRSTCTRQYARKRLTCVMAVSGRLTYATLARSGLQRVPGVERHAQLGSCPTTSSSTPKLYRQRWFGSVHLQRDRVRLVNGHVREQLDGRELRAGRLRLSVHHVDFDMRHQHDLRVWFLHGRFV